MPVNLFLHLLISSLKRNLKIEFIVAYVIVKGLKVQLIFNKNTIKLGDNKKYIKKAINIIAILYTKQEYNSKNNILFYLKVSLN